MIEPNPIDIYVFEDEPFLFKVVEWDEIFKDNKLDPQTYTNVLADSLVHAVNGCCLCFKRNYVGKTSLRIDAYCKHKEKIEDKVVNCRKYR